MSTVFEVPCPECARPMSLQGDGNLTCPSCRRCYRLRMGHLWPVDAGSAVGGKAPVAGAPGSTTSATP